MTRVATAAVVAWPPAQSVGVKDDPAAMPPKPIMPSASPDAFRSSRRIKHPPASNAKFITNTPYSNVLNDLSGLRQRDSPLVHAPSSAPGNTPMVVRSGNMSDAGATVR